jgi:hypothetical protein
MFNKSLAAAVLGLALAPAVASADAYSDGRITAGEAKVETRSVMNDPVVRRSLFKTPYQQTDGTTGSITDPAVDSTRYRIQSCERTGRTASCLVGVSAFTADNKRDAYRFAFFNVVVKATSNGGSATVLPAR